MIKELKAWSKLWWFLALTGLVVVFIQTVTAKKRAIASETRIDIKPQTDGGRMITESEVRQLLAVWLDTSGANPLARIPLAEVESTLANHPMVEHAEVYYDAGNNLRIRVTQEEPLLRIIDARGASYYLSREGRRMPLSAHHTPRLPVVTGEIPLFADSLVTQDGHMFAALMELGTVVRDDHFLLALTEQVHVRQGELVLVPKVGRFRFLLGDGEQLRLRLKNIVHYYHHILPGEGWDAFREIDLRYRNQIICKQV